MKKSRKNLRALAFTLAAIMLVLAFPLSSIAVGNDTLSDNGAQVTEPIYDITEAPNLFQTGDRVVEIVERREENVKHFRLPNGSYEAVSYAKAVHRRDEDGVWQDIDNALVENASKATDLFTTSDQRVAFAKSYKAGKALFALNENGYSISLIPVAEGLSLAPINPTVSAVRITNAPSRAEITSWNSIESARRIDNSSSIVYTDIRANTDLEYILDGNDVKENIIVKAPSSSYIYKFELELEGLTAILNDDGSIAIKDKKTGVDKYKIPAPYMYDADGETSTDVSYTFVATGKDKYTLTVTADSGWINEEGRAFPVVIDPSLDTSPSVIDAYTDSANPNINYGYGTELWLSANRKVYIKASIPNLPENSYVASVTVNVPYYYNVSTGYLAAGAYMISENWNEGNITHNNAPSIESTCTHVCRVEASTSINKNNPGLAAFDITDEAKEYYAGTRAYYGIYIMRGYGSNASVIFNAHESSKPSTYVSVIYDALIPGGVYSIQSHTYTRWLNIENGSYEVGANLQQQNYTTDPSISFQREALFKISNVEGTNRYIIRSMTNNRLTLYVSGGEIVTKLIPAADSEVNENYTFYIEWDGYGYRIRPYGTTKVITMDTPSVADMTVIERDNASALLSRWQLHQYTGNVQYGVEVGKGLEWSSIGIVVGSTHTLSPLVWSTVVDAQTLQIQVSSDCSDLGEVTVWNPAMSTGSFTAAGIGTIDFTCNIVYADDTYWSIGTVTDTYNIVPEEGIFYIQNEQEEVYLTPALAYGISDSATVTGQYSENMQKWEIEHVNNSGGYVHLKSCYNDLYLGVDSADTANLIQYNVSASSTNPYTLWKIEKTTAGFYNFVCKATESDEEMLAVDVINNESVLSMRDINDVADDYLNWYLVKRVISIVNTYDSTFYGNDTMISNIGKAVSFANRAYSTHFGIGLYMDGNASLYVDPNGNPFLADQCHTGVNEPCLSCTEDCDENCTLHCGSNCREEHHKNRDNIWEQLYSGIEENDHVYVTWTDRAYGVYCNSINGSHGNADLIAANNEGTVHILFQTIEKQTNYTSTDTGYICMSTVLVHELAHVFGLEEQYDDPMHILNANRTCAMEGYSDKMKAMYDSVVGDSCTVPFCDACIYKLNDCIDNVIEVGFVQED